jgi:hypothetical protein
MAQADSISTAIRQLLSRGWPPKFTSPVRLAHSKMVASLAGNAPHPIYAGVEVDDLDGRPDHQEKVFAALHAYLAAPFFVQHTASLYLPRCRRNYRRLVVTFSASSMSRRSASERDGLSGCLRVHASTLSFSAGESRIGIVSP